MWNELAAMRLSKLITMLILSAEGLLVKAAIFETNVFVSTIAGSGFNGHVDGVGADTMFSFPSYVAEATDGVYVYDMGNRRIRTVSDDGVVQTLFSEQRKLGPNGVEMSIPIVEMAGKLFFGELNKLFHASQKDFTLVAQFPEKVTISALGTDGTTIFAADVQGNRIYSVANGVVSVLAGSGNATSIDGKGIFSSFRRPEGISVMAQHVFTSEPGKIRRISLNPPNVVTTFVGGDSFGYIDGDSPSLGISISSVATAANGSVAFIDNDKIRRAYSDGRVTTLAGSEQTGFSDGEGSKARFRNPRSLVLHKEAIWVADTQNNRIRKVEAANSHPELIPLDIGLFPGVTISGVVGRSYRIEATPSLEETNVWAPVATFTLPKTRYTWVDESSSSSSAKRFYRAVLLP